MAHKPTRTLKTEAAYLVGGQRLLSRALKDNPWAPDAVDALISLLSAEPPENPFKASTTRVYKARIKEVLQALVADGHLTSERAASGLEMIAQHLLDRRGKPKPRTSAKKVKDARPEEVKAIVAAVEGGGEHANKALDRALLLFLAVEPHAGLRWIEWQTARMDGAVIVVRNGKATNGRAPGAERPVDLSAHPEEVQNAARAFIALCHTLEVRFPSWEHFGKAMAERLNRICVEVGGRRLALYSFRHVAVATWKRAGLDRVSIAALMGHASIDTAGRHYASGRHGWEPGAVAQPGEAVKAVIIARKASAPVPPELARTDTWSEPSSEAEDDYSTPDLKVNF
jgi:integrase